MDPSLQHLIKLYYNATLPKDHVTYLYKLKQSGFKPKVVYDIGSCVLTWTKVAKELWPNAKFILFDAYDQVEFLYKGYDYHIGVLSDEDGKTVKFYQNDIHPGGNSYYKEIGSVGASNLFNSSNAPTKICQMLDTVVKTRDFPLPDLIKIDVQGSEMDVINGGLKTIKNCQHLIVELQSDQYNENAPLVTKSRPFIENLGFKCVAPLFCNNGPDGDYGFINQQID